MNLTRSCIVAPALAVVAALGPAVPALAADTAPARRTTVTGTHAAQGAVAQTAVERCTDARLDRAKTYAAKAVDARLTVLAGLQQQVTGSDRITDAHRTVLTSTLTAATDGVTAQGDTLQAATTCTEARAAGQVVVQRYRVYTVLTPQVALVLAGDAGTGAADRLAPTVATLTTAVAALADDDEQARAEALLEHYAQQVDLAAQSFDGVADTALQQSPDDHPGSTAVFAEQAARARTGATALAAAADDAEALAELLAG